MVLGLRSRHRRGASVKVDYIVHVEEIRPWPPSESLRSVQTVLLQWENGNQYTGSFPSTFQGSKIVFKESFKLPLILYQDKKVHDKFQKNLLEFSLFVLRKDKAKGQLLGTAVVNLADYGVVESTLSINVPVNFKKSSNNSVQSALVISLEPVVKDISNSSPNVSLSKETSLDNDYDNLEIACITDDDASSQSSRTAGSSTFEVGASSPPQIDKNVYANAGFDPEHNSGRFSSTDASSSDTGNHGNDHVFFSKLYDRSMTSVEKKSGTSFLGPSVSSVGRQDVTMKPNTIVSSLLQKKVSLDSNEAVTNSKNKTIENIQQSVEGESFEEFVPEAIAISADNRGKAANESYSANSPYSSAIQEFVPEAIAISADNRGKDADESYSANSPYSGAIQKNELQEADEQIDDLHADLSNVEIEKKRELTYMRSADQIMEEKKNECKNEWETRVEMLEGELREAAAIEVGLYSVVAEHASSANKVHTPARRLSRFYTNACKEGFQAKRASAARAVVSGLVLVSKSCGHDVPRLTFWLSNAIMLRAIVSQNAAEFPHSDRPERKVDGAGTSESDDREDVSTFIIALEKIESWLFSRIVESLWWQTFTPHMQPTVVRGNEVTLGSGAKKAFGRRSSLGNCEQGNFSTELWNKAFKDACERLCPLRAGGHECGCLTVLVRLVMEQLVNRLDVAMFNAILRESAEEMPTDPLSDPISDSKVLPIPAGKSSFGAGVELKNSIGNWSRWLTDIFGLDEDSTEHDDSRGDGKKPKSFKAFRLLHTLSDLMMLPFGMLADASTRKEVCPMFGPIIIKRVLSNFVPDEFCPDPIPQNIIDSLETEEVSEALEDLLTSFPCTASPTTYTPPSAALLTCVGEVGSQVLQSSRLSSLRKSYNSDDELDELDSPSASILPDSFHSSALAKLGLIAKEKGGGNVRRYQLLREIWKDE